ncbi:polysaccharide deacetylase family protein [Natronorarus salvus]|uniref:polysaccharide deacetylase family protein n=1 Tax=Natronorarus salvus TaxID=3117733 RepID=UPI002F264C04
MTGQERGRTRRGFLRTTGAGAAGLAWAAHAPRASATGEAAGLLVLVYDDSPAEDYTKTFRVHREYDVPGCIAACPGLMEDGSGEWLSPGQLREIHAEGWEVMSHTNHHRLLGEVPLEGSVEAGETRIPVRSDLQGRFSGDPLVFIDGDSRVEATAAGREREDDDERFLLVEEGLPESLSSEAVVRYTDAFTEEVLAGSQSTLEGWLEDQGGRVDGYVHTYDWVEGVRNVVPSVYDATPNGRPGRGPFNPDLDPDPLSLTRGYVETDSMDDDRVLAVLDTIATDPDFGVLAGHSNHETLPEERIRFVIEEALERDIEIVTLQEALHRLGVLEARDERIRAGIDVEFGAEEATPTPTPAGEESDAEDDAPASDDGTPDGGGEDVTGEEGGTRSLWERLVEFLRSLFGL